MNMHHHLFFSQGAPLSHYMFLPGAHAGAGSQQAFILVQVPTTVIPNGSQLLTLPEETVLEISLFQTLH